MTIGPSRIIVVSPTVVNIQSFFIYDDKVCRDDLKYIATIKNTTTIGNGTAIFSNSNLKVRIF